MNGRQTDVAPLAEPALEEVLAALSDPVRMRIVRTLAAEPDGRPCGSSDLRGTKSPASHHFRVLREAGLIEQEHRGRTRHTTLRRDHIERLYPGLLDLVLSAR